MNELDAALGSIWRTKMQNIERVLFACVAIGWPLAAAAEEPFAPFSQSMVDQARAQLDAPLAVNKTGAANSRYRFINGEWWYLLDNQQWAHWNSKEKKWSVPSRKSSEYQEWRQRQFADRYDRSEADDETMRRPEVDRWRASATQKAGTSLAQSDADYHRQVDRFHDTLMTTPYDYRIGTAGHGLFDADPDRTIANSGRFNYATSSGGFMGGAMRTPFGY